MSTPYLITGVATHPQDMRPRLEIRELQKLPEQFTLFQLGWAKVMSKDFTPEAARFEQLAGIHGMPYTRWPGDPDQETQSVRGPWLGYCNHASVMFPNWHRPYVMAIEQPICEVASGIAGGYASECKANKNQDQADKWLRAARDLRFPFWDWTDKSTGAEGIPSILRDETVQLIKSDGQTYDHPNVLAYYSFNKPVDGFTNRLEIVEIQTSGKPLPEDIAYFREWNRTYRRPNSSPINVTEDYNALNADLENKDERGGWANLTNDIAALFTVPPDIPEDMWANMWVIITSSSAASD
ncbi:hypothetical protein FRC12_008393 [Ceratobasidium sp. 428]|nr:hypothetical protein FRC12_008393 [Ceratobasidium sp. 428]